MGKKHRQVDAYIAKSAPFAPPILKRIREVVHAACPDVEEAMKWGSPFFLYHGILCLHMAAFTEHCALGFWHAEMRAALKDANAEKADHSAGQFGRLTKVGDLPTKAVLTRLLKQAMNYNESVPKKRVAKAASKKKRPAPETPPEFAAALAKNKKAQKTFEEFSPRHRREYIEWIAEAKRDDTRDRRIKQALEWLAAGKSRHWKYK